MARNRRSSGKKRGKKKKGGLLGKLFKWLILLGIIGAILGGGGVAGLFYYYGRDLPELLKREDYQPKQLSRVYASDGELIGEFIAQDGRRTVLAMDEIPDYVRYSFMAAEDADFMTHEGIDYFGMARAFYYAVRYDAGLKGTSTITQQVIKNLVLTPERKIERKIKEIILARELEKNLTKEDILYLYLNTIYLGHGNYGVEEASRFYFGKSARDLDIHEAAVLAGITQSPERLSPKKHPEEAKKRRAYVLEQLWKKGFIEEATYREADKKPIETVPYHKSYPHVGKAPYFVEHVRKLLVDKYGPEKVYTGGLRVHTTLDLDKQTAAKGSLREGLRVYDARREYYEPVRKLSGNKVDAFIAKQAKALAKKGLSKGKVYEAVVVSVDPKTELVKLNLGDVPARLLLRPKSRILGEGKDRKTVDEKFERGHVLEVMPLAVEPDDEGSVPVEFKRGPDSALVSIDPKTRDVVAMVGGYSFEYNEYNHATQAKRQTGSTFKPFVYGAALASKGVTPATIYLDSPAVFKLDGGKSWSPKNSDGRWRGPIRVREGLGASRNVVAVRILRDIGLEKATEFAKKIGIKSPIVQNFTMVMGSSEITPLEMTNAYATFASGGLYGEPRFITRVETANGETDTFETRIERVLAPEVAYIISDLMTAVTMGYVDSSGTRRGGTAGALRKGFDRPFAGKTGTTNESRDAWFIGFTPQYVAGAWVGFGDNSPLGPKEYGGRVAGPIWRDYMKIIHEKLEVKKFEPPSSGISTATIDPATGKLARQDGVEEVFLSGTAPTTYAPVNQGGEEDDFLMNQFGTSANPEQEGEQEAAN
ncbi:PBP1A family penicillin-binding protein [Persicimonas caeni]|uniref:PBP1A family penicillin-binding protein n=1 Tax=Persicimonas caeni TaxID=2292766 RepID=A0A4Y6PN76_PERCE|nr:PBP1A family penicillin-binding protein [Persicimonas caeni]QDG49673.1 PBP1A family penicillin-binding protein [Persicimonas caeni]QED30894.1 PBP1A family penicillin-binding protein [Persicimonas caeni]